MFRGTEAIALTDKRLFAASTRKKQANRMAAGIVASRGPDEKRNGMSWGSRVIAAFTLRSGRDCC